MENVDENEGKWKSEGGKWWKMGQNEKVKKKKNQKYKGKNDWNELRLFFSYHNGNVYREKAKNHAGKKIGKSDFATPPEKFPCCVPALNRLLKAIPVKTVKKQRNVSNNQQRSQEQKYKKSPKMQTKVSKHRSKKSKFSKTNMYEGLKNKRLKIKTKVSKSKQGSQKTDKINVSKSKVSQNIEKS